MPHETGRREVIGLDLGEVESEAFWIELLRDLRRPGVRLCVSDQHEAQGDRQGAGLPVAALHCPLRPQHAPTLPAVSAWLHLRRAARDLQRRRPRAGQSGSAR